MYDLSCFSVYFWFVFCLSNAMHGQNINLPVCVCVSVTLSVNFLTGQTLNGFLQLIA